ncbi:MAG: DNA polymerase III subunit beta [Flavobacteriaceae bacterium]|nr:DNA polymerase III subunit beta [Flavobacteriaceae bacterium]
MKFNIERNKLLLGLQKVAGVVERKSTQPILSHVFLHITSHQLKITGSDLEVEISSVVTLTEPAESGEITVPARKLLDICKALPHDAVLTIKLDGEKVLLTTKKSRFTLSTLPVDSFPRFTLSGKELEFNLNSGLLKDMISRTFFSVAQQDVRFYLNGLLMQIKDKKLFSVTTDGHRLSLFKSDIEEDIQDYEIIIPKKGINELQRLLDNDEIEVEIHVTDKHLSVSSKGFTFISKLIEGKFPDYNDVLPKESKIKIQLDRDDLKNALNRVSILTNEKYKGVSFQLKIGALYLMSKNPEHEEAEEELPVEYTGDHLDIGFNVSYLLDILNHIPAGKVELSFTDSMSSVLVNSHNDTYDCLYVVMPMRI